MKTFLVGLVLVNNNRAVSMSLLKYRLYSSKFESLPLASIGQTDR